MKIFYDFFSIIAFFIVYKLYGFYEATIAINALLIIGLLGGRLFTGKFDKLQSVIVIGVILLSIPTLLLHEEIFFKWKPTLVSWLFAGIFFCSRYFGDKKTLFGRALEKEEIFLSEQTLQWVNNIWIIYFIILGAVNIIIAYHCSTDVWVNFKLFGTLGSSIFMMCLTMGYLYPQIKSNLPK